MRFNGRVISAGDVMFVWTSRAGFQGHVRWDVSDFSPATGKVFARRWEDGRYEELPHYARFADELAPRYEKPPLSKEQIAWQRKERDECIAAIRERDRAAGIVSISSGSIPSRSWSRLTWR